jgi:hypothetical protein
MTQGWLVPDDEKRRIVVNMLVIVNAPRVYRNKKQVKGHRTDPVPSERERIQAARVLAFAHAADTAIFRDCLAELHLRERLGLEADPWAVPTPTGQPVGPSATKAESAAEVVFSTPATVETPAGTLSKELTDDDLDDYVKRRFARHFGGDHLPQNGRA